MPCCRLGCLCVWQWKQLTVSKGGKCRVKELHVQPVSQKPEHACRFLIKALCLSFFSFRSSFFFFLFFFRVGGCGGNFSSYILIPPPPSTRRISPHPSPTLPYAVLQPPPPAFPPPASSTRESTTGGNAYFPFRSPRLRSTVYEDANPFKDVPFFLLPRCFILSNLRFSCRFFP